MSSNPFSTRFIRPGAIPFLFPAGESAESLVERLSEKNWQGQIIGPHGSGKSTLLAMLIPALEAAGRSVIAQSLHQGERRMLKLEQSTFTATTQFVIDGYEQLTWLSRRRVKSLCRQHGMGLLVTVHADAQLPTIYRTDPNEAIAQSVVEYLTRDGDREVAKSDVLAALAATNGNLREALFRLYDVYEHRVPPASP